MFYAQVEKVIKDQGERGLTHLEYYYGLKLEIHRQLKHDVYSQVHGKNSGSETQYVDDFIGVLESDDFLPSNGSYSGGFETGFLYTRSKVILVGDTIKIKSKDGKNRRFRIDERQQIGFTTEIFTKWKLTNIGD